MRPKNDTGMSPNTRYDIAPKSKAKPLSNAQIIRIFCDYNKVRKIKRGMIYFEEVDTWFTIWDQKWLHKLNGQHVRVRMATLSPNYIYLFDAVTDTYLTYVERTIEVAGDRANMSPGGEIKILAHSQKLKGLDKSRKKKLEENNSSLEKEDSDVPELPDSFNTNELVVGERQTYIDPPNVTEEQEKVSENLSTPESTSNDSEDGDTWHLERATVRQPIPEEHVELEVV